MNVQKRDAVFDQYIRNHHLPEINRTLRILNPKRDSIRIPYAQFLFSIIDYFSLLYVASLEGNNFRKTDKQNFYKFFKSKYFPEKDRNKAAIIYFIRNGVMHQIFPKKAGLNTINSDVLIYRSEDPILNLNYLESLVLKAIENFLRDIENDSEAIDRMHKVLIAENYIFNDDIDFKNLITNEYDGNKDLIYS